MSDDLRTRIAAVQAAHCQMPWGCLCGWKYAPLLDDSHYDHVADAVIREIPELQARCDCQQRNWADSNFKYGEHYGI